MVDEFPDLGACDCEKCRSFCKRPCWPTPDEAQVIIDAGHGAKLMLDYWMKIEGDIYVLCGANPGYEGAYAPGYEHLRSGCVFQVDGLCSIHDIKPCEGRKTMHDVDSRGLHEAVAMTWDTERGREVVAAWREKRV